MSPYPRKVKTASGATAVQVVAKDHGVRRIVEHLGSARDETELEALLEAGRQKIAAWQGQGLLDLESLEPAPGHTNLAGQDHGGVQALQVVEGGPARRLPASGAG